MLTNLTSLDVGKNRAVHAHFPWVCVAQVPHFGKHIIAKEYEDCLCDKT